MRETFCTIKFSIFPLISVVISAIKFRIFPLISVVISAIKFSMFPLISVVIIKRETLILSHHIILNFGLLFAIDKVFSDSGESPPG